MKLKLWYRYMAYDAKIKRKYIEIDKVVSYNMEIVE